MHSLSCALPHLTYCLAPLGTTFQMIVFFCITYALITTNALTDGWCMVGVSREGGLTLLKDMKQVSPAISRPHYSQVASSTCTTLMGLTTSRTSASIHEGSSCAKQLSSMILIMIITVSQVICSEVCFEAAQLVSTTISETFVWGALSTGCLGSLGCKHCRHRQRTVYRRKHDSPEERGLARTRQGG
ncbi:hypothetical protein K503DRAFT_119740 [Rhizopogon vinicolor AM-OR11-026]|uniref:Uncharacterized protein n=1 Tax=Rhizopogon vinicolor AM-OR11-026 TaxID=1314800 RepID=A0A1B7N270_9AGAM|nr:hypothetical protein K503DRAFT_119740 [Rhizopogon vinicolor AM-OR11-026]